MQRPENYNTKQSEAISSYLSSISPAALVTAAQVAEHFHDAPISRTTVYRQLEKLARAGVVRKHLFDGSAVVCYEYVGRGETVKASYHLKCESCGEYISLECLQLSDVSHHIFEAHEFQVNDTKTVFYGKCKTCLENA